MASDFSSKTYTRKITIGGREFTAECDSATGSWSSCGGPKTASFKISSAHFDETYGILQGDDVIIQYDTADSTTKMWRGVVTELQTTLTQGLTINATGKRILLNESVPTGIFGTLATTGPPLLVLADTSDVATGVTGIQVNLAIRLRFRSIDAEGTTDYTDTTTDPLSLGFNGGPADHQLDIVADTIAADKKLDLSWTCGNNASGVEIEVIFDPDGGSERKEFYNAVGDSISIDGSFNPTEGTSFFVGTTSRVATIAGTTIEDVVNHLLDNFLPTDLSKGTVEIGSLDVNIDLFDLRTSGADLNIILSTLRDIAGDVMWYIDADDAVQFVAEGTTSAITFQITQSAGVNTEANSLVGLTKRQIRDGITLVKVEGEEALEENQLENRDTNFDNTTLPTISDPDIVDLTRDGRVFSIGLSRANTPTIPVGATKANFIDTYSTLQNWLDDFPNQRFLYTHKEVVASAFLTTTLDRLRTKAEAPVNPFSSSQTPLATVANRPRVVPLNAPGVSTIQSAGIIANNYMLKRNPNPVQWTARVELIDTLFFPGIDRITIINTLGYKYTLPLHGIDYKFDETISANFQLGDQDYDPITEMQNTIRSVSKINLRKQHTNRWL